tara:strand:- start:185 stop:298 length:114 start_codon:yes stop_codon:yes gene_type:complete
VAELPDDEERVFLCCFWKNRHRPAASHRYVNYLDVNK